MTTIVPVRVAGELVIKLEDLPEMALGLIKSALTIPNEEREKAAALKQFNWFELPETVALYRTETRRGGEEVICLPRGFAAGLVNGLTGMGIQIQWDDQRTFAPAEEGYYRIFLSRDYQAEAALAWMKAQQGFVKGPAGSGKTVLVLWALAMLGQRALVITDKTALANQWRVRAHQFYNMPIELDDDGYELATLSKKGRGKDYDRSKLREVGMIGQNIWEERDLTVCLRQTLHERAFALDGTRWWQNWGAVIFDEGHHLVAETLGDICRKITSVYLGGVSATPWKTPERGMRVTCLVGPIVHEIPRQILYERDVLMKPEVQVLQGDFYTDFWPDHDAEYDKHEQRWKCQKPDCKVNKKHGHRNNYSSVLKSLVESKERNARIADKVVSERGHYHLIPSRQLKHLDLVEKALVKAGWPKEKIWKLRGEENAAGMDRIIDQQLRASDEGVLLSTVADEGLDIPPLDRVHVIFPMRDPVLTEQIVGRIERVFPGKPDCIAEGELVLTDHGLVPIESVSLDMKVWDGVCFVTHDGIICKGVRPVVEYAGLSATPDHKVWSDRGWESFLECARRGGLIAQTGDGWRAIRESDHRFRGDQAFQSHATAFGSMCCMSNGDMEGPEQLTARNSRLRLLRTAVQGSQMADQAMHECAAALHESVQQDVCCLWSQRDRVSLFVSVGYGSMGSRESWLASRQADRQGQQRWSLRAWQPEVVHSDTEHGQQSGEQGVRSISCFSSRSPRGEICRCNSSEAHAQGAYRSRNCGSVQPSITQTQRRVWDILNAGPRHRFTVAGLLVSNCIAYDYREWQMDVLEGQYEERAIVYRRNGYVVHQIEQEASTT